MTLLGLMPLFRVVVAAVRGIQRAVRPVTVRPVDAAL
jgi:hypothetical protein